MDKDIAELIIHALIKRPGMQRAGSRHGERRRGGGKKSGEEKREREKDRKPVEGKGPMTKCKTEWKVKVRGGGGLENVVVGFLAS